MAEYKDRASSKPERCLLESLLDLYPDALGGALVEDVRLAKKHLVFVDVLLHDKRVVVEYDGEYWHRKRSRQDKRKTRELLRAGYSVVRVREYRGDRVLPLLDMEHESLRQLIFDVAVGDYKSLAEEIGDFISSCTQ